MTGECGLRSANVTLPPGVAVLPFAGIPEHLLFYGFVMVLSLLIYSIMKNIRKHNRLKENITMRPSLAHLALGKEDDWLIREAGIAAYQYVMFLRMHLQLAFIFCVISGVSLAINISQNFDPKAAFDSTTSSNIPPKSELHWFNVIISFCTPWLVVMMAMRMSKKIGYLKPMTTTFNRTLFVESSTYGSGDDVVEYFEKKYPEFELIDITSSVDTDVLQALVTDLEFTENVLEVLHECQDEEHLVCCFCCNKTKNIEFYKENRTKLSHKIVEEKERCSEKTDCILFLTFLNFYQAEQVYKHEKLESNCCSLQGQLMFAPLPEEIIWSSVHSSTSNWRGWIISTVCILILVIFCSTPSGFASQIQHVLNRVIGDTSSIIGVSTFLPPLLLILFNILVPLAVKTANIDFGSCSRPVCHSAYMWSLYRWLACSIIIFPIILASAANMMEFFYILDSGGWWKVALDKWECVFSADTGSFYTNLLVVVAFLKCQIELHRVGALCILLFSKLTHCKFWETREAAMRKCEVQLKNLNGNRLALADEYVWVVVYFTVWMFFCLTCPIITPAFLIFIVCKYLVVIQNFRGSCTAMHDQPELLTTATKQTIFASLFLQINFTLFMIIRQSLSEENSAIIASSIFLLLINLILIIINHKLNWSFPIKLFHHSWKPADLEEDDSCYQDNYENPYMTRDIDYDEDAPANTTAGWKHLGWVGKKGRQARKFLQKDKIFYPTVDGATQKAFQKAASLSYT